MNSPADAYRDFPPPEALRAYTWDVAYAGFHEDRLETIELKNPISLCSMLIVGDFGYPRH